MTRWSLDRRLASETLAMADLPLCRLLLRNEHRFPWLVLVPRLVGVRESFALAPPDRARLWHEADETARALSARVKADKMNLAAFGNMVPQLHLHVIGRKKTDPAWPKSAVGWDAPAVYAAGSAPTWWRPLVRDLGAIDLPKEEGG